MEKSELYEYVFEKSSEEERKSIISSDIPIPVIKGNAEISKEDKEESDKFLETIMN